MTKEIIITNPSEGIKSFFAAMKERKEQTIARISKKDSGIFTVEV